MARFGLGAVYQQTGKTDEAIAAYRKVIELAPDSVLSQDSLAYVYAQERRNPDKTLAFAKKASDLAPRSGNVEDTLGWVYFKKGRYQEAEETLKAAADLSPRHPSILYHPAWPTASEGRKKKR